MIKVQTKSIVSQNVVIVNQKQKGGRCICIYISEKISLEKYLCSPMYSGGHTIYIHIIYICYTYCIYTWYLHNAATRGLRSIHHQTGRPGCRGARHHHNQASIRHSRKSTSLSEMKVWYLWNSEAASQALHPPSSRCTEEEQFMELFWVFFKGELTYKTKSVHWNYIHIYANSKYGTQLYIDKTGPLLWPRFTIPVRFGILAL